MSKTETKKLRPFWQRIIRDSAIILLIGIPYVLAYFHFNLSLTQGEGPTPGFVPAEPFKRIWSKEKHILLGLGDSITAGYGSTKGFSFFDRLYKTPEGDSADMVGKDLLTVLPNLVKQNDSRSGTESIDHVKDQIQPMVKFPADTRGIVIITTGGNDIIHQYGDAPPRECAMYGASIEAAQTWINNYRTRLTQMMKDITERFPGGCEIFLLNIYDPTDGTGDLGLSGLPPWEDGLKILEAYNRIIAECAEELANVHHVDIHTPFLGHGIHCKKFWNEYYRSDDPHYWYDPNIEDPNNRGYDEIRRQVLIKIIEVYAQTGVTQSAL